MKKKKIIKVLFSFLSLLVIINLLFSTASNFKAEHAENHDQLVFSILDFFSTLVSCTGTLLLTIYLIHYRKTSGQLQYILYFLPIMVITIGTLAAGKITYFGEDLSSFAVILFATCGLFLLSIFFLRKLGKSSLAHCFILLYSPTLSYYSAHQWVEWNTRLFADQITKLDGWNFEVDGWKYINIEYLEAEDVLIYHWTPLFRRFAIKVPSKDNYGLRANPSTVYTCRKIDGKLLITDATHVWWNSSGETCVWPCRR